jgi:hypothetical protein
VEVLVQGLAGVLLQVRPGDADLRGAVPSGTISKAARPTTGSLELADLVALGQVRVEVVLAVEHRAPADLRVDGEAERTASAPPRR